MENPKRPKHVVCILGMHRSGTSALTGSLQKSGLELGKHHTWNPHNKRGNRENQDIVDLHDAILASNKGNWSSPPRKVRWLPKHIAEAQSILASNSATAHWGFKDPRTLLCLSQWKLLVEDISFIGIFRHPLAVANSLHKRGKMPIKQGVELWYQYNKVLYKEHTIQPFPLLSFDWDESTLHSKINEAAREIGLNSMSEEDTFYSSELHHHTHSNTDKLPWLVRRLYKKLQNRAY